MKEQVKLVSVIVPTFNRKSLLEECVESLMVQDYPDYEVIVVDDGSTDGTGELLINLSRKYSVLSSFSQKNGGSYAARNLGIKKSNGGIICFTDDDCRVDPDWINNLIKHFDDDEIGGVGGKIIPSAPTTYIEEYSQRNIPLNYPKKIEYIATCNAAYRKDLLDIVGGFDINFRSGGDRDMSTQILMTCHKIVYEPDAIIHYRYRSNLHDFLKQWYLYGKGTAILNKKYPLSYGPEKADINNIQVGH